VQIVVAVAVALTFLIFLRPGMIKRLHAGPTLEVGAAALVGRRAHVLEPLTHVKPGRIKIGGDVWTAQPFDEDDQIDTGASVEVISIKGATAYVVRAQQTGTASVSEMED
jgi:membrane protein implicated in regulation of membrane protease activity